MLTWNCRDSTPLSAAPRSRMGDQGWIFWSYKSNYLFSLSSLPSSGPYRIFVIVFNWNHFEMKLLNLRINFYLLRTLFLERSKLSVSTSERQGRRTRTQTGGGLLYWPFLIPRCDTIFRAFRLCFPAERFSIGFCRRPLPLRAASTLSWL